jgi:hypothetical protein
LASQLHAQKPQKGMAARVGDYDSKSRFLESFLSSISWHMIGSNLFGKFSFSFFFFFFFFFNRRAQRPLITRSKNTLLARAAGQGPAKASQEKTNP